MSITSSFGAFFPHEHDPHTDSQNHTPHAAGNAASEAASRIAERLEHLWVDEDEERAILQELRALEPGALEQTLSSLDLNKLVDALDDRLWGEDNRSALLNLLARERVGELSITTRARLVSALQKGFTGDVEQRAIRDLFLATHGDELTELKNAIDAGGDDQDLEKLVFRDLSDERYRQAVLDHIASEAQGRRRGEVKIYSDIDDTFYASLNDDRYPIGTVYPGVRAFYEALDQHRQGGEARTGDLNFLTARPTDPLGAIERYTHRALRTRGAPEATILTGPLAFTHKAMAEGKLDNFRRARALYPEYDAVLIGDSGQGDIEFGAKAEQEARGALRAVWIHDVTGLSAAERERYAQRGIELFDTYAGAAASAYEAGLIDEQALERVARAALEEMRAIDFATPEQRAARFRELRRDLERVNRHLSVPIELPSP